MSLVLLLVALAVLALLAAVVTGRLDASLPAPVGSSPARPLPSGPIGAADVDGVRFSLAVRGYRMDEVDDVLARLRTEIAARDDALAALSGRIGPSALSVGSVPGAGIGSQPAVGQAVYGGRTVAAESSASGRAATSMTPMTPMPPPPALPPLAGSPLAPPLPTAPPVSAPVPVSWSPPGALVSGPIPTTPPTTAQRAPARHTGPVRVDRQADSRDVRRGGDDEGGATSAVRRVAEVARRAGRHGRRAQRNAEED